MKTFRNLSLALTVAALAATCAHAQANRETATEAIHLQAYGTATYTRPDFGNRVRAGGFGVGGAIGFTVPFLHKLEPGIDARYTYATNPNISESFYGGGARLTYHLGRLHPYGDFMLGQGNITFKQPIVATYTHDNSLVYMYGGGVDLDITRSIAIRADAQQQHWQLSQRADPFHPVQFSLGIRYAFHFRNRYGME